MIRYLFEQWAICAMRNIYVFTQFKMYCVVFSVDVVQFSVSKYDCAMEIKSYVNLKF